MKLSRFWELIEGEFGDNYAHVLAQTLVLTPYQLTVNQALGQGIAPREVWEVLCHQQDVPENRRLGPDVPPKN